MAGKWCVFMCVQLERLKAENSATVARLSGHLHLLWDRVNMSQEDRRQFLAENAGVSQRVVHSVWLVLETDVLIN